MKHPKLIKWSAFSLFTLTILTLFSIRLAAWFDTYQLKFQSPVRFYQPVWVEKRVLLSPLCETKPITPWNEIVAMIVSEFKDLGPKVTYEAIKIAWCESRWNELAKGVNNNNSTDGGVFQANSVHKLPDAIRFDALENIKWAKQKYIKDGSWRAWVCAKKL
jgi:hypothetical protein